MKTPIIMGASFIDSMRRALMWGAIIDRPCVLSFSQTIRSFFLSLRPIKTIPKLFTCFTQSTVNYRQLRKVINHRGTKYRPQKMESKEWNTRTKIDPSNLPMKMIRRENGNWNSVLILNAQSNSLFKFVMKMSIFGLFSPHIWTIFARVFEP